MNYVKYTDTARSWHKQIMQDTIVIERKNGVSTDEFGTHIESFEMIGTYPAIVQQETSQRMTKAEVSGVNNTISSSAQNKTWIVKCPVECPAELNDRLTVQIASNEPRLVGEKFKIIEILFQDLSTARRLVCERWN